MRSRLTGRSSVPLPPLLSLVTGLFAFPPRVRSGPVGVRAAIAQTAALLTVHGPGGVRGNPTLPTTGAPPSHGRPDSPGPSTRRASRTTRSPVQGPSGWSSRRSSRAAGRHTPHLRRAGRPVRPRPLADRLDGRPARREPLPIHQGRTGPAAGHPRLEVRHRGEVPGPVSGAYGFAAGRVGRRAVGRGGAPRFPGPAPGRSGTCSSTRSAAGATPPSRAPLLIRGGGPCPPATPSRRAPGTARCRRSRSRSTSGCRGLVRWDDGGTLPVRAGPLR